MTDFNQGRITVNLGPRSYPILIGFDLTAPQPELQTAQPITSNLIITDRTVLRCQQDKLAKLARTLEGAAIEAISPGERSKSLRWAQRLYQRCLQHGLDRQSVVHAVGGGVVGDLAGFVAATYLRGIRFRQYPTSLLAMIDASVGGKVGVDFAGGKNLIGAIHQPLSVTIDLDVLRTLPCRQIRSGLGEALKTAVLTQEQRLSALEGIDPRIIRREPSIIATEIYECCRYKANIVAHDEFDLGPRQILNLGHTFGHAFESAYGFQGPLHGEAVAIGVLVAAKLAELRGLNSGGLTARITGVLRRWNLLPLPWKIPDPQLIHEFLRKDKKCRGQRVTWILPEAIGSMRVVQDVSSANLGEVLKWVESI